MITNLIDANSSPFCVPSQDWSKRSFRQEGRGHQHGDGGGQAYTAGHRDFLQHLGGGDAHERSRPHVDDSSPLEFTATTSASFYPPHFLSQN